MKAGCTVVDKGTCTTTIRFSVLNYLDQFQKCCCALLMSGVFHGFGISVLQTRFSFSAVDSFETTSLTTGCTLVKMNGLPSPVLCGLMLSLVCQMGGTLSGDPRSRNDVNAVSATEHLSIREGLAHISGIRLTTVFGHFLFLSVPLCLRSC